MIQAVDAIPEKPVSNRERIRTDIREAMENGIHQFEFTGDAYNYHTLHAAAREVAEQMSQRMIRKVIWEYRDLIGEKRIRWRVENRTVYKRELYPLKVSSIKSEVPGMRRVFCRIETEGLKEKIRTIIEEENRKAEEAAMNKA